MPASLCFVLLQATLPVPDAPPITEHTVGRACPVISSSYDYQPQIATLPSDPHPRVIPVHKTPRVGPREGFAPQPKQYGGFIGIEQTVWAPPDPTLAVGPS